MSKANKHKTTSAERFQDYLEGKLNKKDQYDLEKRLLDDDFESEALEGMESVTPGMLKEDLADLKTSLSRKSKKSDINYWAVAAVFVTLISATISLFYFVDIGKDDQNVVRQETPQKTEKTNPESEIAVKPETDSIIQSNNLASDFESKSSSQVGEESTPIQESSSSELIALSSKETSDIDSNQDDVIGPVNKKIEISPVENRNTSGFSSNGGMKETQLEPIPETGSLNRIATTEVLPTEDNELSKEKFEMPPTIAYSEEMEEVPEYEVEKSRSNAKAARKMAKSQEPDLQSSPSRAFFDAGEMDVNSLPYPIIGMDEYIQYLKKNIKEIPMDSILHITFLISDKGGIVDFTIEEKLNRKSQKDLENIINNGSKWIPASINGISIEQKADVKIEW